MTFGDVESIVPEPTLAGSDPSPVPLSRRRRERPRIWRGAIFVLAVIYFIGPLAAAFKYSLVEKNGSYGLGNYGQIVQNSAIRSALLTSLEIGVITAIVVIVLMLPTVVWVRLRLPQLTLLMEGVTLLPIVIPPVVLAAGLEELQGHAPGWLVKLVFNHPVTALSPFYVILAMPFAYRALDTGVRAIDLRTLVDASRSLGASWRSDDHAGHPAEHADGGPRRHVPDHRAVPRRGRDRDLPAVPHLPGGAHPGEPEWNRGHLRRALDHHAGVHLPPLVRALLPGEAQAPPKLNKVGLMIRFEGVQRHFGQVTALAGLDLEIDKGELIALLGPSGCGKTTALRILGGFDRADAGRVFVNDRDVSARAAEQARHGHGLSGLQPVPEHGRAHQRRLRAAHAPARQGEAFQAGRRAAGARGT